MAPANVVRMVEWPSRPAATAAVCVDAHDPRLLAQIIGDRVRDTEERLGTLDDLLCKAHTQRMNSCRIVGWSAFEGCIHLAPSNVGLEGFV